MTSLFIEVKYARLVGTNVERWKVKSDYPFHGNGRCPVCGDSRKNKSKCRFHVREHQGTILISCFNCGLSTNLSNFLKLYHPDLHREFVFEKYRNEGSPDSPVIRDVVTPIKSVLTDCEIKSLPLVSEMKKDSLVSIYVSSRKLPKYSFYYAENFSKLAAKYNPVFEELEIAGPRLVIPFFDRSGNIFAFQGRDLTGKSDLKYITISINPKIPTIFGIDKVSRSKQVLIVEGPLDSLFLPNCVAAVNSSLVATAETLQKAINKEQIVLIYDNEPRNPEIVKAYEKAIKAGYKIVIWPKIIDGIKDINDMVLRGIDYINIIKQNTYSGLMANIEFSKWKKL